MYYLSEIHSGHVKAAYHSLDGIPINGFRVTKVPSNISIDHNDRADLNGPLTRADVNRQKYNGLLATAPIFTEVHYGDLEAASEIVVNSPFLENLTVSGKGVYWFNPDTVLKTFPATLNFPVNRLAVHWDVYTIQRENKHGKVLHYYKEVPLGLSSSEIEIGTYEIELSVTMFPITIPTLEDQIRVGIENKSSERLYLGGYAIFY